jgi:hypothetical protein
MMRIAVFACLCLAALSLSARAADIERKDGNFIFGTSLILHTSKQVGDNNMNYWSNLLPLEYMYSTYEIVKVVNAARAQRGISEQVDVKRYPIQVGMENVLADGYEYNIDFAGMSPEDVAVVVEAFPFTGPFSDARLRVQPVNTGYYYGNSLDGESLTMDLPGGSLSFNLSQSGSQIEALVAEKVKAIFGEGASYDFSWSVYKPVNGMRNLNANLTVYLDASQIPSGPIPMDMEYRGE